MQISIRFATQIGPDGASPRNATAEHRRDEVALLFERAFAQETISGNRPDPVDWASSLEKLENLTKTMWGASRALVSI